MNRWILLGALLAVLDLYPALGTAVLGLLGAVLVAVAAKPVVLSFAAGLIVGPRLAARIPRSLP